MEQQPSLQRVEAMEAADGPKILQEETEDLVVVDHIALALEEQEQPTKATLEERLQMSALLMELAAAAARVALAEAM
jgi:hypothetical protein